jgi:uncharacterized protein YkwD
VRILLILAAVAAGVASVVGIAPVASAAAPTRFQASAQRTVEAGVLVEVNAVRRARGLPPLRVSPSLNAAAAAHSRDMAAKGYFEHESSDGSSFEKRLERFYGSGGRNVWSVGENILWAAPAIDPRKIVAEWMSSREHRDNLLSKTFREIGVSVVSRKAAPGVFAGENVMVVTSDFGLRR